MQLLGQVIQRRTDRVAKVRDRFLHDVDSGRKDRVSPVVGELQLVHGALRLRLDHHGTAKHRSIDHLATQPVARLDVRKDALTESTDAVVGSVGPYPVGEQDVGLFGRLKATDLLVEEFLRAILRADVVRDRAVHLPDPKVQYRNLWVLDPGVEVVVLQFRLNSFVVGEERSTAKVSTTRGLDVVFDDSLYLVHVPADRCRSLLVADKVV